MKLKKFASILIIFFWFFSGNLSASESIFAAIHDLVNHEHNHEHSDKHNYHVEHHPFHNSTHENNTTPEHQPHDECSIKSIAILSSSSVKMSKLNSLELLAPIQFSTKSLYKKVITVITKDSNAPPPLGVANTISSRAPPSLI